MKKEKKIEIQTVIRIKDNLQFLLFNNYIISVIKTLNKEYEFHFYNKSNFKKKFILKIDKDEKEEDSNYEIFKLIHTKNKKIYLIGYQIFTAMYDGYKEKKLGLFKFEISRKKIEKIATYIYEDFYLDLKEDKIYISDDYSIITYDLLKDISSKKEIEYRSNSCYLHWEKIFLIDNYFMFISFREMAQYMFFLFGYIYDKNFEPLDKDLNNTGLKYIFPEWFEFRDYFFQISDNYFLVNSFKFEQKIEIDIAEVRIKGNENLIKSLNEEVEDLEKINVFKRHTIEIDEVGELTLYPIDNERFGINISNRNIYIYKMNGLELIWKFNLNFNNNEKILLIAAKEKNEKYKLVLGNKNSILFLSS